MAACSPVVASVAKLVSWAGLLVMAGVCLFLSISLSRIHASLAMQLATLTHLLQASTRKADAPLTGEAVTTRAMSRAPQEGAMITAPSPLIRQRRREAGVGDRWIDYGKLETNEIIAAVNRDRGDARSENPQRHARAGRSVADVAEWFGADPDRCERIADKYRTADERAAAAARAPQ